jgi:hypothetical protein
MERELIPPVLIMSEADASMASVFVLAGNGTARRVNPKRYFVKAEF